MKKYIVLAYYHFVDIKDPEEEVKVHREFLQAKDARSRIYISKQGINGQMSISEEDCEDYISWLSTREYFKEITVKRQYCEEHVFPRLTIKVRSELVAFGAPTSTEKTGDYLTPSEWKEALDCKDQDQIILDTRNDYEWKLGHFDGSELFNFETFKQFKVAAEELKKRIDPQKTKVLMYCTGGIRCELFSSYLKEEGFKKVCQLKGGIIQYGKEVGIDHWSGKLFVFDDRLAVDLKEDTPAPAIGECHHCKSTSETYYNCANMDCNALFLSCPVCLEKYKGCCKEECKTQERVRPFQFSHKPFRKWYHYAKTKKELRISKE